MKNRSEILSLILILIVSVTAIAKDDDSLSTVDRRAIRCEKSGGGFAILEPQSDTKPRIWLTEKDSREGAELKILKWVKLRCPDCYDIKVQGGIMGENGTFDLFLRGDQGNLTLEVEVEERNMKFDCKRP